MKFIFILSALLMIASRSFGQTDSFPPPPSSTSSMPGLLNSQRNFIFIDITQNTWLDAPGEVETKFWSGGFNANIFYDIHVAKSYFSIAPGISFSNATVKSNAIPDTYRDDSTELISPDILDPKVSVKRNKISTSYFDIPVELRFRIKPDQRGKNFWIAPGFRVGFRLSDFWKFKTEDEQGNIVKTKYYDISNIESLHYGISLRTGYYKFGLYAFYSLTYLFEKNKGTQVTPFSVGITLTPF